MAYQVNWEDEKTRFITGEFNTLIAFSTARGLSYSTLTQRAAGWLKEREEYHEKIGRAARASFLKEKVVSAESLAEEVTTIMDHMISQYHDLNSEYKHITAALKKAPSDRKSRAMVMQLQRSLERSLVEIGKYVELLSGRATARAESGKIQKDKLDEFYNHQKGILDKMRVITRAS